MDCKEHYFNEDSSVNDYSPGPVQDEEELLRMIFSPIHWDKDTGKLTTLALHDAVKKGLSVNRITHVGLSELRKKVDKKIEIDRRNGKDREFIGFAKVTCKDVRKIVTQQQIKQAFYVYDTATQADPSHADVCQEVTVQKYERNKLLEQLRELFQIQKP